MFIYLVSIKQYVVSYNMYLYMNTIADLYYMFSYFLTVVNTHFVYIKSIR